MKHLVIAGGGYGGIKILTLLLAKGLPEDVMITLIDRFPHHSLKTEFYALAAGTLSDAEARAPFPIHDQVHYVFEEIVHFHLPRKEVLLKNKQLIRYDYLVIGLGAEDNYHGIEGAREFSHSVQSIGKTRKTFEAIQNTRAYGQIAVIGGGLTGIEIASELRQSRPDLNITLFDRGDHILRGFPEAVVDHAERWFDRHDVSIVNHAHIDALADGILYNDGTGLLADVSVWSAGIQPAKPVRELDVEKDKQGRILVNRYYQVRQYPTVYVVGDCAGTPFPTTAQVAKQQGKRLAGVLHDVLRGEIPKRPSDIELKGTVGSLGKSDGFGMVNDMPMKGFMPRLVKSGILWMHRFKK